jgi:hypothetical protein
VGSYTASPASTSTLTSPVGPDGGVNEAGITSIGSWNSGNIPSGSGSPGNIPPLNAVAELENIPAPVNVQLGGTAGTEQVGSPQQWAVTISLSGSPLQIVPNMANSQNVAVSAVAPNVFTYTYLSRQEFVCTVSSSGLITATGRGQCEVEVWATRSCNLPFVNATPSGVEGVRASLLVTVVA